MKIKLCTSFYFSTWRIRSAERHFGNCVSHDFACPQEPWNRFAFCSAPFDFSNLRDSFFMSWSVKYWFCQGISRGKQNVVSTRDIAGELCWPSMSAVRGFDWLKSRARCIISHVIPSCVQIKLFLCYRSVDEQLVRIFLFKRNGFRR